MTDKLSIVVRPNDVHKITPSVDYNWWLKRFDNNLINKPIKINSRKSSNKKTLSKTLGTSVIYSPMSPLFMSLSPISLINTVDKILCQIKMIPYRNIYRAIH